MNLHLPTFKEIRRANGMRGNGLIRHLICTSSAPNGEFQANPEHIQSSDSKLAIMIQPLRRITLFLGFLCLAFASQAQTQGVGFFAIDPPLFIQEFSKVLNETTLESGKQAALRLPVIWDSGKISEDEKASFIKHVNSMVEHRYRTAPDLASFALAFIAVKSGESYASIDVDQFFEVTEKSIEHLEPERTAKFFINLRKYLVAGHPMERKNFHWTLKDTLPELVFLTLNDENGEYHTPVIRYTETDIFMRNKKDSTKIFGASGDFHPLSMSFVGTGGRVNWSKVGLDSAKVYADFHDFTLNFNFGLIQVDTVTFHYDSLLSEPLTGYFEDRNLGYSDVEKANYPYFKSYEGGVVIENFIPNVRYEGGFSIMGTRKIGSSYDIWTEYVPEETATDDAGESWYTSDYSLRDAETRDDEWEDSDWETSESDASSWDSESDWESSDWGDDEWGSTDESGDWGEEEYGEEEIYEEEESIFSNLVKEHIFARMEIFRDDRKIMTLEGEEFVLGTRKMVSNNIQASIYPSESDSIFHPSMDVLYSVADSTVILNKHKRGIYKSIPFTSSYHEYFMYFETIAWDISSDELAFTAFIDKENKVSAIESFDYFTKERFSQFKNILKFNPIGAIYRYHVINPGQPIFPENILKEYNMTSDKSGFERTLPSLVGSGFIDYDPKSQEITPKAKLIHWARAARQKKDFDAIQIISKVDSGSHAIMDLETMDVQMRGVNHFSLSDSVFARVVPLNGLVQVQKNRNLQFAGAVACGNINFYSSDEDRPAFTFDYETFKVLCDSIESLRFVLVRNPSPDYEPTPLEKALSNTVFEGVSGAIHIDDPNNKSGAKRFKNRHFPVFDSYSQSYIYWDKPNIEGGVYEKERMFFAVDPFVLDSLEDLKDANLFFDGEFHSGEIFPKFRQTLTVMEDFTLGFKMETPPYGFKIYEGLGRFNSEITLDGNGLQGNGTIEYLGTIAESDSFVFHFDSVMAEVRHFNLRRGFRGGVYFPEVDAKSGIYKWFTKDSTVAMTSVDSAFNVFNGEAQFEGTLSITPKGMIGDGEITLGQIRIRSDSLVFKDRDFMAPKADFIVVDEDDPDMIHFLAEDVNVTYDVWRHKSSFESLPISDSVASIAHFPMHQYGTSLGKGEYQRSTGDLKLQSMSSYMKDNYFVSTDPKQDSLNFNAEEAVYKLETKEVFITGVPYIYVADALITPDEKEVTLLETGFLSPLENATVEADQETKLHRIYESTVSIKSRHQYEGGGKYDYIEVNGQEQFIEFNNIQVNSDTSTIASGVIEEEDGFYLTERIFFKGNTYLDASRRFLTFEGEVKIESDNPVFKGAWFTFEKTIVNPDSVFIPISEDLTNELGEELTVGLNFVEENTVFYSNFLQAKEDEDDFEVLSASGGLTFDRRKKEFKIGSREKLRRMIFKGATVAFNDEKNTITSQGFLKFPYDFKPKTITMKMAGSWKEDLRNRSLSTNIISIVDMPVIPQEQLNKISENLQFLTASNENIDFQKYSFRETIAELLDEGQKGERETAKFNQNVDNHFVYTDIKLAEQLPFTLLLSGVNYNYDRTYKALYHDGPIGLIGVNGNVINKMVKAKILYEFGRMDEDGEKAKDKLTIYLEVDKYNWIYFYFEDEIVKTMSSYYDEYNYPLQDIVSKRKNESGFRFDMATEEERSRFLQKFQKRFGKPE
ncbi:hypothetical protein [Pontibacter sp. G13]|uniref:hypothetical protein n=1 Tax=Pontibacter sp. G13 TaxID=3074898 RepID=UPI00288922D0|nr:hypothetical protein [Pontibacter sp. G13]WNJ21080.1 hypothetical protein RJD25_11475 [Pontibacter sp. G13]